MADAIVSIPEISPEGVIYYKFPDATFDQLCEMGKLGLVNIDPLVLAANLVAAAWRERKYPEVVVLCNSKIQRTDVMYNVQSSLGEVGMIGLIDEELGSVTAGSRRCCYCVLASDPYAGARKCLADMLLIVEEPYQRVPTQPGSEPGFYICRDNRIVFAIRPNPDFALRPTLVPI